MSKSMMMTRTAATTSAKSIAVIEITHRSSIWFFDKVSPEIGCSADEHGGL